MGRGHPVDQRTAHGARRVMLGRYVTLVRALPTASGISLAQLSLPPESGTLGGIGRRHQYALTRRNCHP
jgi:hypothetical protein